MKKRLLCICSIVTLLLSAATLFACGGKKPTPSVEPSVTPSPATGINGVYSAQNAELILEMGQEALSHKTGAVITGKMESTFTEDSPSYDYELALNFAENTARFTLLQNEQVLFVAYGNESGFLAQRGEEVMPLETLLNEYGLGVLAPYLKGFANGNLSDITKIWDDNFGDAVLGKTDGEGYMLSAKNDFSQKVNAYLTQFRPLFSLTGKELVRTLFPSLIEGDADEWFAAKKTWLLESPVSELLSFVNENPSYTQIASHLTLELFDLSYVDFLTQYGEKSLPEVLAALMKKVENAPPALTMPVLLKITLNTLLQNLWDMPVQQSLEDLVATVSPDYEPYVDLLLNKTAFTFAGLAAQVGCNADGTPSYGLFSVGAAGVQKAEENEQIEFRKTVLLSMHFSYQTPEITLPDVTVEPSVEPTTEPSVEPTVEPTTVPTTEPTVEPTTVPSASPTAMPDVA
ncbi:MAG: hypothetical protein II368_00090 [Clostridia bacterium]|nr:hypothetical protein [Clostridia bacterium]